MYNNISPDPSIGRLCQLDAEQWRQPITTDRRMNISSHLNEYLQIEHDNPNLIWLYSLMLENEVKLSHGEVVSAMRLRILDEYVLTPLAWRYLANGTSDDFRVVLDSSDPGGTPNWQWKRLIHWLQILCGLRRDKPIPEGIQCLFINDSLLVHPESRLVQLHGAWLHNGTLRHVLEEAENQLMAGTYFQFAETELIDVFTWLSSTHSDPQGNQQMHDWKYLSKRAAEWKADIELMEAYQDLKWDSALPQMQIDDWIIEPVVDAWSLQRLAFSQCHCAHKFIEQCLEGEQRIFVILNSGGKTVATIRLALDDDTWVIGDLKGFANSDVSENIRWVGEEIARCYGNRPRYISAEYKRQVINL